MRVSRGRHKTRGLTKSQWEVLVCIRSYVASHGISPSLADLSEATDRWASAIKETLKHLEAKGYISLLRFNDGARVTRGIVVKRRGREAKEPNDSAA
jgi:SOS-response transcriptional repressor LexA